MKSGSDIEFKGSLDGVAMLDEPSLSRQWVARRLQRALSVERWGAPLRVGLGAARGELGATLRRHSVTAESRLSRIEDLIRRVGSEPYGATGLAARLVPTAVYPLARASGYLTAYAGTWMAAYSLSEYGTLEAFVQDAPGIDTEVSAAVQQLRAEVDAEVAELAAVSR